MFKIIKGPIHKKIQVLHITVLFYRLIIMGLDTVETFGIQYKSNGFTIL
jgi:hypothetical protein